MNELIAIDPKICFGKPVVKGTRTPVTIVLGALAGGDTFETVMEDYEITLEQVLACIAFANDEVKSRSYHPLHV